MHFESLHMNGAFCLCYLLNENVFLYFMLFISDHFALSDCTKYTYAVVTRELSFWLGFLLTLDKIRFSTASKNNALLCLRSIEFPAMEKKFNTVKILRKRFNYWVPSYLLVQLLAFKKTVCSVQDPVCL